MQRRAPHVIECLPPFDHMSQQLSDRHAAWIVVFLVLLINAAALLSELSISRFDVNDSVFHYTMADRMVQAFERGENPLDCWVSEWTLGYPVSRTYQPLGHFMMAVLYLSLAKSVSLMTLFVWVRYLLVVLLPLSVYVAGRQLRMTPAAAAASALISPLISTNGLFGIDYGSFVWSGSGLFTQAMAMHFLLFAVGFTAKSMRNEGSGILGGVILGLTFVTHFIYGYVGALTACLIAAVPNALPFSRRLGRLLIIASAALCISAFELVPALMDSPLVNHSRWEPAWKWDSFGATRVMGQLVSGELMDFGRLPVLTLLVLLGALTCIIRGRRGTSRIPADIPRATLHLLFYGGLLWLLLFCGRPTWGGFFNIFAPPDIQLHRLIGGVHLFFILVGGVGLATVWRWIQSKKFIPGNVLSIVLTILILFPAIRERGQFLAQNGERGRANLAAFQFEQASIDHLISTLRNVPGRVYPGLAAGWGRDFRVGDVPIYGILGTHHIPAVAFLYHAMALTSDIMVLFDEQNRAHYDLFNVSSVISDGRSLPSFVHETQRIGRFRASSVNSGGYFAVVRVPYAAAANKQNFYNIVSNWLQSDWLTNRTHLLLAVDGSAPPNLPRLPGGQQLPPVASEPIPGTVESEDRDGEQYSAVVQVDSPAYVLFKMTYHPNWKATVNGLQGRTVMLTPGFIGVPVEPGKHRVQLRYSPGPLKMVLLFGGMVCLGVIGATVRYFDFL